MKRYFDIAAKRHEEIIKEAVIGAAARLVMPAVRFAVKNPLTTIGAAFTGSEIAGGVKNMSRAVEGAKSAPANFVRQTF